ncbi:hypothetical protein [Singulisphaera sp. PoT]|uniref:hypothetical protein n=1 Tax=Singulisphaera sp. PoT TaxID=3411797 RepID=UPI003BF54F9A
MSDDFADDLPVVELSEPCRHLRSKGMYVYTDGSGSGSDSHPDYDNTIYWCLKTMKSFGPDDEFVAGEDCRHSDRTCYEPI